MWFSSLTCRPRVTGRSSASGRPASIRPRKFRPALEALEARLVPATFNVTSLADSNVAGSGSLRAAISASNATAGPNTIDILTPGTYALTLPGTPFEADNAAGQLSILNNSVSIQNLSGGAVVIDATGLNARVLEIAANGSPANVTIGDLITIQGGNTTAAGGGILVGTAGTLSLGEVVIQNNQAGQGGGGIFSLGTLSLDDTTVANNSTTGSTGGGGILQVGAGTLTISDSLIEHNRCPDATAGGGGVLINNGSGAVTISDSEFSSNGAGTGGGGGLLDAGTGGLTMARCTFNDNHTGGDGGGLNLQLGAASSLVNITVSGNGAEFLGGGIANFGAGNIVLVNATIVNNEATQNGGGIFSEAAGALQVSETVVAKNIGVGGFPDVDNNNNSNDLVNDESDFIGDNTGAADSFVAGSPNAHGSFVGTAAAPLDPLLEPLADNGGFGRLPDGSHLLTQQDDANQGPNGLRDRAPTGTPFDERSFPVADGARDIGAFEFQDFDVAVSTSAPAGPVHAGQPATFTLTVTNNGPNTSRDVTLAATLPEGTTVVGATPTLTFPVVLVTFLVPDLAPGTSTSFTLTVIPAAPGPFTATATVSGHDDPNLANNTATASVTVLPRPFPATGFADVTALVRLVPLGPHPRRAHKRLLVLLTNVSGTPLQGPLGLVVLGLRPRRGPRLLNASGRVPGLQPFVLVNGGADNVFDPGARALAQLVFSQPLNPRGLRVLAGAFA